MIRRNNVRGAELSCSSSSKIKQAEKLSSSADMKLYQALGLADHDMNKATKPGQVPSWLNATLHIRPSTR